MTLSAVEELIIKHEGMVLEPYRDTVGKLTIGVGHNLDDNGISEDAAIFIMREDLKNVERDLDSNLPWWNLLDFARRLVLLDMGFNLGINRLLTFKKMLAHLKAGRYEQASDEMIDSKWATQVGERAQELAIIMETGEV